MASHLPLSASSPLSPPQGGNFTLDALVLTTDTVAITYIVTDGSGHGAAGAAGDPTSLAQPAVPGGGEAGRFRIEVPAGRVGVYLLQAAHPPESDFPTPLPPPRLHCGAAFAGGSTN